MDIDIGTLFLLHRVGLIPIDALLETALPSDIKICREITKELGGLPLALDQAGAYIERTQCSLSQYLHIYSTHRFALLESPGSLGSDHPESVAKTWSLSFEVVEQRSSGAADLLRLCAYLSPDAIPEEIITQGAIYLGSNLAPVAKDLLLLNDAIAILDAYSLIHRRNDMLTIHRLVQAVLKEGMNESQQRRWAKRAVQAVNNSFPEVETTTWFRCEPLLPHAQETSIWTSAS
ncbi:hypothetical protein [Ktedonospora formicarum]|uniref:DUF7779 domain-containing protein n=1 Tax=Ktedonospora formicarum TaxID=2778364 RepID=UPI001C68D55A|nr:hypothetical protein [Ktedonospora formicarum]